MFTGCTRRVRRCWRGYGVPEARACRRADSVVQLLEREVMSNRKKRGSEYRKFLVDRARETGGILVNAEGGQGETADLRRLAREGKLKRVRVRVPSPFGPHIKRTYYVAAGRK